MMHSLSACVATCGNSSLIHAPVSPCCLNDHGERSSAPVDEENTRGLPNGSGFP
jgi:hypothetical protein